MSTVFAIQLLDALSAILMETAVTSLLTEPTFSVLLPYEGISNEFERGSFRLIQVIGNGNRDHRDYAPPQLWPIKVTF